MQKSFTTLVIAAVTLLLGNVLAQQTPAATTQQPPAAGSQTDSALKTQKDKVSYAIGMNIGTTLHRQSVDVDPKVVAQGLQDALSGGKTLLSEDEARATLTDLQNDMRKKQQEKMQAAAETNKKEGDAFLAANKAKEGVVTLPSGLQYKVLTPGTGPKPGTADSVACNYKARSSMARNLTAPTSAASPRRFRLAE